MVGGHYGADVTQGMTITQERADELLKNDIVVYENHVNNICSYLDLNQNQYDALVSFTYNCGSGSLLQLTKNKTRTLLQISEHIEAYNKGAGGVILAGLVRRRKEEKELFLTPIKEEKEMFDDENKALDYLVEKGRISDKEYWKAALIVVKNLKYLIIKWANDIFGK